jgi:hypothetical protein
VDKSGGSAVPSVPEVAVPEVAVPEVAVPEVGNDGGEAGATVPGVALPPPAGATGGDEASPEGPADVPCGVVAATLGGAVAAGVGELGLVAVSPAGCSLMIFSSSLIRSSMSERFGAFGTYRR